MNRQTRTSTALSPSSRSPNRRNAKNEKSASESRVIRIFRGAAFGILSASGIGLLLLLITTGIVYAQSDPDIFLKPAALLVLGVASLLCGVIAERTSADAPAVTVGIAAAAGWLLLCFLLSLAFGSGAGAFSSLYALALRIPQFLLVVLGAFLAKSRPRKPSNRRRR